MVRYRCDRHRILKENRWMCILHQYHKASGLKLYTLMCRSGVNIKYISIIQDGGAPSTSRFFSPGDLVVCKLLKEYEIITLI